MTVKFFITGAAFAISLAASAQTTQKEYTYAEGELATYGFLTKQTYDVAILIDNATLTGKKITGIKAYINGTENFENTSVWLSSDLKLDGVGQSAVNDPDLGCWDVNPTVAELDGESLGVLDIRLPEPYLYTGEPVYVGYSLTTSNLEQNARYPVIISKASQNGEGLFLHTTGRVISWSNYVSTAQGVAAIEVTFEGEFPSPCVGITGAQETLAVAGNMFDIPVYLSNQGDSQVTSIDYSYVVGDQSGEGTINVNLPADLALKTPVMLSFGAISKIGAYPVEIKITKVNGADNKSDYATATTIANINEKMAVKRALMEEFTGTWCGNCPRGTVAMELINEYYPERVVAYSYHCNGDGSDPMQVYPKEGNPFTPSALPTAAIDRTISVDPYYGTQVPDAGLDPQDHVHFAIGKDLEAAYSKTTIADIEINATYADGKISVTTDTRFMKNISDANYAVGCVLVANGLSGTTKNWDQENYYSGAKGYEGTPLQVITELPAEISGMVYEDVAVNVDWFKGRANSIPSEIKLGENYVNEFEFDVAGNPLAAMGKSYMVAAFIINNDLENGYVGTIVNANKFYLSDPAGVGSSETDVYPIETVYYDLNGRKVIFPQGGIFIRMTKMSDGTTKTEKFVAF